MFSVNFCVYIKNKKETVNRVPLENGCHYYIQKTKYSRLENQ